MGWHDLGAVAEVHLVPVVGRWVVRRRYDDSGGGVDLGDRPRQYGCRHDLIEQHRPDAARRQHARRVERVQVALAAGVVADDHTAFARTWVGGQEVRGEACRGLPHHEPVHALWTRSDSSSQTGGTELEPALEPPGQLISGSGEQRLQLGADVVVRFACQPAFRLGPGAITHSISVCSSTRGRGPTCEITSDAAIEPSRPHSFRSWPCVKP